MQPGLAPKRLGIDVAHFSCFTAKSFVESPRQAVIRRLLAVHFLRSSHRFRRLSRFGASHGLVTAATTMMLCGTATQCNRG